MPRPPATQEISPTQLHEKKGTGGHEGNETVQLRRRFCSTARFLNMPTRFTPAQLVASAAVGELRTEGSFGKGAEAHQLQARVRGKQP